MQKLYDVDANGYTDEVARGWQVKKAFRLAKTLLNKASPNWVAAGVGTAVAFGTLPAALSLGALVAGGIITGAAAGYGAKAGAALCVWTQKVEALYGQNQPASLFGKIAKSATTGLVIGGLIGGGAVILTIKELGPHQPHSSYSAARLNFAPR